MINGKNHLTEEDKKVFDILSKVSKEYVLFPKKDLIFEEIKILTENNTKMFQRHDYSTPLDLVITRGKENALLE